MNESLVQRILQCSTLPTLPAVALQILELTQNADTDIAQIAKTIARDPALSSKILRTVNSTFYGRSHKISTISHALVILGLQSVKTLVLGFSLATSLVKMRPHGFKHRLYWKRSIYGATAARCLAGRAHIAQQEECFLASLLMDIGMLVLDQVLGEEYGKICEGAPTHQELLTAERNALQITHAAVSGLLAEHWKLPPLLCSPLAHHHTPADVKDPALEPLARIVQLASRCADIYLEEAAPQAIQDVRTQCLDHFKITEAECNAMLEDIGRSTREVAPLFELNLGELGDYEAILKRANDALVELTLHTQQQAATLREQNEALQKSAFTDGLTGLANRARFDQFLQTAFARVAQVQKSMAVLLMDIDHFKQVNDRHGHPAGDQVLKTVAKAVQQTIANRGELAARYGGEEMVIVMPGATRAQATARAELVRQSVAGQSTNCEGKQLSVTISVGVAVYDPDGPLRQATHLLKAADLALYAAKHSGRNCVRVFSPKPGAVKAA